MNSRRFHQAGMKKCQAGKEEMQVGAGSNARGSEILLWPNFLYDREISLS